MSRVAEELLAYDSSQVELGLEPWSSIESFTDEERLSRYRRRVCRTLHAVNEKATARLLDASVTEEDYERPFIFVRATLEPAKRHDDDTLIAMDALYDFMAADGLDRVPYCPTEAGDGTRTVITKFINGVVARALSEL